jgi:signal transduction histidine kinase
VDSQLTPESTPLPQGGSPLSTLDRLSELVNAVSRPSPEAATLIASARDRARRWASAGDRHPAAVQSAGLSLLGACVAALAVDRTWSRDEAIAVFAQAAETLQLPTSVVETNVFAAAVADAALSELPPEVVLTAQLGLFAAFSGTSAASLWTRTDEGDVEAVVVEGPPPDGAVRAYASALLEAADPDETGALHGLPILRWEHVYAAFVYRADAATWKHVDVLARELASRVSPVLERRTLLERNAARERSLVASSERRLARLGFDLHDGPIQDVVALGSEVRLFRRQLATVLEGHERTSLMLGRVDDVEARLVALDRDLRELSRSLESPTVLNEPLPELVRREVEAISREGLEVALEVTGTFEAITPSQGIALLRIVQEALQNAEQHSGADNVRVSLGADARRLSVEITDDGVGFEVEATLVEAARGGHLGIVGMGERVRLLGGEFDVESRVGGPTSVSATIPRWRPPAPQSSAD